MTNHMTNQEALKYCLAHNGFVMIGSEEKHYFMDTDHNNNFRFDIIKCDIKFTYCGIKTHSLTFYIDNEYYTFMNGDEFYKPKRGEFWAFNCSICKHAILWSKHLKYQPSDNQDICYECNQQEVKT